MLDTKNSTASPKRRRRAGSTLISAQPLPQPDSEGARSRSRDAYAGTRLDYASAAEPRRQPLPDKKPSSGSSNRLARSEAQLMTASITATAVVCGVLVFYLCAYAHIASLGIRESQARVHLRQVQAENETLTAAYDGLRNPQRVVAAATALKMQNSAPTITYIDLSRAPLPAKAATPNDSASVKAAELETTTGEKPAATGTI